MAVHRHEGSEGPFAFDAAYDELATQMRALHFSRIDEMPRIELYLDQLLSLVGMELAFMYAPDEKVITGAMVNNYVKQRLIPAPRRKRYTRRHLASLLFVCTFKRVLSIAQVSQLLAMCDDAGLDTSRAYDELAGVLERAISAQFTESLDEHVAPVEVRVNLYDAQGAPIVGELNHLLECAVMLVADKVYLEHLLALEARRAAV